MSARSPLVSILIPCYNAERWIAQTVEAALGQTWGNTEIVVVNDGSTDASRQILDRYLGRQVRIVDQENRGQTAALNRCLGEASGDFIQYLDADDLIAPDKIEQQLARLKDRTHGVATSRWARFREDPAEACFEGRDADVDIDPVDWLVENWKDGGGMMYPAMWLIPRSVIETAGAWREDLTLANDTEYFSRVVLASESILHCSRARTYYRSGTSGSLSGLKSRNGWSSCRRVLESCEHNLLQRENSERTRRVCSLLWQRLAVDCYPYDRTLGNEAMERATALHRDALPMQGGVLYRSCARLFGWRTARILQRIAGRT